MKFGKLQCAGIVALAVMAGLAAEPALAQRGRGQAKVRREARREQAKPPEERQQAPPGGQAQAPFRSGDRMGMPRGKGPGANLPPRWMERLREMTPEERERFMQNNERFRQLRPERQQQIRENFRRWDSMTPEQRQEIRRREAVLESMTPEERRRVREEILPRWQQMQPDRRQAILRRLRGLRGLSDEERDARLKDEAFLQGLSAEDRDLLRELARLRIGPGGPQEPPQDNPPLP